MAHNQGQYTNFHQPGVVYMQHGQVPTGISSHGYPAYYMPTNSECVSSQFANLTLHDGNGGFGYATGQYDFSQYHPSQSYGNGQFMNQVDPLQQPQYYIYTETVNPQGGVQQYYRPGLIYVNPHTQIRKQTLLKHFKNTRRNKYHDPSDSDETSEDTTGSETESDDQAVSPKSHKKSSSANQHKSKVKSKNSKLKQPISLPPHIKHYKNLGSLGSFAPVDQLSPSYALITKYVKNSHNIRKSKGTVVVHQIFECNGVRATHNSSNEFSLMLWFKTNPESVKRLSMKQNQCVAFYDRICRASVVEVNKLQQNFRQIIVLCSVTLGRLQKSEHGFNHWAKKGVPMGYNSVMGLGKLVPNMEDCREEDLITFPCGRTVESDRDPNIYDLQFNEYFVFTASQIKVKYAVDVEIKPI